MVSDEFKEWRCNECGQEVVSKEEPNPIRWADGHVCSFSEYEEPDYSELDPARHQRKELGKKILIVDDEKDVLDGLMYRKEEGWIMRI